MRSTDMIADVARFHQEVTRQESPATPTMVSPEFIHIRWKFAQEENDEFLEACHNGDMVKAADGLADLIYVAIGTAYLMGIPLEKVWDAVQRANMKKVGGATARNPNDAIKPPGWQPPDVEIATILLQSIEA